MARIPGRGNLGQVMPAPQRMAVQGGGDAIAQGMQGMAQGLGQVAEGLHEQRMAADQLEAANYSLNYEQRGKAAAQDVVASLSRGEIANEDDALAEYQRRLSSLDTDRPKLLRQVDEAMQLGLKRMRGDLDLSFQGTMGKLRADRGEANFVSFIDGIGKEAGATGADIDSLNAKQRLAADRAIAAGVPRDRVERLLQDGNDRNWYNAGYEQLIRSKDSMKALSVLESDLTKEDGRYNKKMDTDRRNSLLSQVINAKDRLQARIDRDSAKRLAAAERSLNEYQNYVSTGLPPPDSMTTATAAAVKGTALEKDFHAAQQDQRFISDMLKKSPIEQQQYIMTKERELQMPHASGSMRDVTRLNRLKAAFEGNIKAITDEPLEWSDTRTDSSSGRINMAALMSPDGTNNMAAILRDRLGTLDSMRRQYGNVVGNKPLFKEEAAEIGAALKRMTATDRAAVLGRLHGAMGDAKAFKGLVKQTLGDDPTAYAAGVANGMGLKTVIRDGGFFNTGIFRATISGRNVGDLIEQGASILKDKSVIVPPKGMSEDGAHAYFNRVLGSALAPGSENREIAYRSSLAIYAKLAADEGKLGKELDRPLMEQAINIATGGIVDISGRQFVAPRYGMSADELDGAITKAIRQAERDTKIGYGNLAGSLLVQDDQRPGRFYLMADEVSAQVDHRGRPIFVEVQ